MWRAAAFRLTPASDTHVPDAALTRLSVAGGRISGAQISGAGGATAVEADHYVLALPVERAVPLLNDDILAIDPALRSLRELAVDWMNGIMIYLRRPVHGRRPRRLRRTAMGADLDQPGAVLEEELRHHLRQRRGQRLPVHRHLRLGQARHPLQKARPRLHPRADLQRGRRPAPPRHPVRRAAADRRQHPLLLHRPRHHRQRHPQAANEAGRKAANAILEASGAGGTPAELAGLWQPEAFSGIFANDDARFDAGLPNVFDIWDPHRPMSRQAMASISTS